MNIELLPTSGLDLSVLVAVLLGTLLLFYLSEAFGWSFGGLVVPGYLASVWVVSPGAGMTIMIEAVLTLGVVFFISDVLSRTGIWSSFFGRERFLLLVVVSVLVRQASEIWLLPDVLALQDRWWGMKILQPMEAHSVGLVLVPLTANALAKGSILKGLRQLVIPTLLAWYILHIVLLNHTNISLSAMSLTYEDVSLDFLGSARAYFVLLVGSYIATRFNGVFAWSAGGILIPALLGLAWYEPTRVLISFGEAMVIAWVYKGLVQLPVIRHWNLEGARKLAVLFVFLVGLRLGLAWLHELGIPVRSNELSGLGYLLSALIALKMLQFGSAPTVILPALTTSMIAFLGGSTAAWGLEQIFPMQHASSQQEQELPTTRLLKSPEGALLYARTRTRLDPQRSPSIHLPVSHVSQWRAFWQKVDVHTPMPALPGDWLKITQGEGSFGGRDWLIVHESTERLDEVEGWGVALLRLNAEGPALFIEKPWAELKDPHEAIQACENIDCSMLFVAGMELPTGTDDALRAWQQTVSNPTQHQVEAKEEGTITPATQGLGALLNDTLLNAQGTWQASATELDMLTYLLVPELEAWSEGRKNEGILQQYVTALDLQLRSLPCGLQNCLVLLPIQSGPVMVVRQGGQPGLITASHPNTEIGTLKFALGAFDSLNAQVLILDPSIKTSLVVATQDPMQALHLGWRAAWAQKISPAPLALWFRGIGPGTPEAPRPDEDVVIGTGRPVLGAAPPALAALATPTHFAGIWPYRWAASDIDEPGLAGNHLAGLQADLVLGGLSPAVLWFSEEARNRWRSEDREKVAEWVAAAGLLLEDRDATTPPQLPQGKTKAHGKSNTQFEQLADLARRAAHQHNLNLLRKLAGFSSNDVHIRAGWEPTRMLPWLEVEVADGASLWQERTWILPGDGREETLYSASSTTQIRAALGWMPADLRFIP